MDRVTAALEALGIVLVMAAVGWWVAEASSVPFGLCSAALTAWLASWLLQGARLPRRRRPEQRRNR